jgi:hypothetical protein
VRTHRRAAVTLSALALTGLLAGCSDDRSAPEAPPPADPGVGDGDPLQPGEVAPSG